jgi:hypothetical protein
MGLLVLVLAGGAASSGPVPVVGATPASLASDAIGDAESLGPVVTAWLGLEAPVGDEAGGVGAVSDATAPLEGTGKLGVLVLEPRTGGADALTLALSTGVTGCASTGSPGSLLQAASRATQGSEHNQGRDERGISTGCS